MPKAVANVVETERHDLKSLEGAFVELKRMTYGQSVQRRAMMKLSLTGKGKSFAGEMAMASEEITRFEFAHCIVDHNLENEDGSKLDLSRPVDFAALDPRVGQEIEALISEMNDIEDEEGN